MSSFTKRLSVFVVLLVVVSACFQPPPTPEQTPEPPGTNETPLFGDGDIDPGG
jgi:hypothetical protein